MAKRDIQAQYRQSFLGLIWAFIPIIINSVVWIFLNSSGAVNVTSPEGIPYSLYVVIGTTIWSIFVESLQSPINSINSGRGIISKINFPKEALLVSGLYKLGFNLALKIVVIFGFLLLFGITPTSTLIYFPFYLLVITIFSMAIGVLLTPMGLLYTDIGRMITMGAQFLMYVTPVVYMMPKVGTLKFIFEINPLTYLINDARNSLTGAPVQDIVFAIILLMISFLVLSIGLVILRKSMNILIEKIS
ncbi:ABC transporter permease [Elizabethkingia sp. JS20170427COW]|uniref:ABC transporter permease n=1 Tax=Elizabethkingia sp. JS20170427COW TaxID=2583851 RepID=UPI0011107F71|nr:ABC transporter permease [Elizabethkingia sp. JS20170427COW]QCX53440.1 ABC transporter permease [Elizabethkingia sp. JS20170427COW]